MIHSQSPYERYLDLIKIYFYYLYDLYICSDYDQTQILMNPVYKKKMDKHIFFITFQSTSFWRCCQGIDNILWWLSHNFVYSLLVHKFLASLVVVLITWKNLVSIKIGQQQPSSNMRTLLLGLTSSNRRNTAFFFSFFLSPFLSLFSFPLFLSFLSLSFFFPSFSILLLPASTNSSHTPYIAFSMCHAC